jgi:multiple sugar transport system substrate-binding protein
MQDFIGSLSRRAFLKVGVVAGAVGAMGSFAATSVAAVVKNPKGLGKVSYWNHFTGADERAGFAKVSDAFKKASPAIDVGVQTISNDDWMPKYIAATVANSGPDAVMITAARFSDMRTIGGLKDITTYNKRWPGAADVASSAGAFSAGGKVYGVPFFSFIDWMYYRKDLFDAAGIKKAPTTLQEFREAAIALNNPSKGQYGFAMRGGSGGGGFIPNIIHAYNGPFINPHTFHRTVKFETVRDALTFWVNLAIKDKAVVPTVVTDGYAQIFSNFATGKAAMVMHHTGSFVTVGTYWKYGTQVETAARPRGPKAQMGSKSPLGNGLFKSTQNPDAAFEWVSFIGSAAPQVDFLKATGYFPASAAAVKDPFISKTPQYDVAVQGLKTLDFDYTFPGYSNWMNLTCLPEFQKALTGSQSAEAAARKIYDELGRVCAAAAKANRDAHLKNRRK